jgi:hypothetical protein
LMRASQTPSSTFRCGGLGLGPGVFVISNHLRIEICISVGYILKIGTIVQL